MRRLALATLTLAVVAALVAALLRTGGLADGAPERRTEPAAAETSRSAPGERPVRVRGPEAKGRRDVAPEAAPPVSGLLAVTLRAVNGDRSPAAAGVDVRGEDSELRLWLQPPSRDVVRIAPGTYEVSVLEDSRPESSRRWTPMGERSRAQAVIREGGTTEVVLLVETPGSITARAPEGAAVSLEDLTLHRVGEIAPVSTGEQPGDGSERLWRWLGPGTYELRSDLLREPTVVPLAAGEHRTVTLDLPLTRVVLRPELRAEDGGPVLAAPCHIEIRAGAAADGGAGVRVASARVLLSEAVRAGASLEVDLAPGSYEARVRAHVNVPGVASDLRDASTQTFAGLRHSGQGFSSRLVAGAATLHLFDAEPGAAGREVLLRHDVKAVEGVASIEIHVEGEGELWLHSPPDADGRRTTMRLRPENGRIDVALDVARYRGEPVELTASSAPGEGAVLLREVITSGRREWRVVVPKSHHPFDPGPAASSSWRGAWPSGQGR